MRIRSERGQSFREGESMALTARNVASLAGGLVGVYRLGDGDCVKYVGRSDTCLKTRLMQHVRKGRYTSFSVYPRGDAHSAYREECFLYHESLRTLDNLIHPDRPNGSEDVCPYCRPVRDVGWGDDSQVVVASLGPSLPAVGRIGSVFTLNRDNPLFNPSLSDEELSVRFGNAMKLL